MVKVLFWDVTAEAASFWFTVANATLLFGAIAVAIGTYGSVALGAAKEHFADARIAENEAETARALARAAEANLKAEQERFARLKIEERLAPRSLTDSQRGEIINKIRMFSGQRFQFVSYQDDPEVKGLVLDLIATLSGAGWEGIPAQEFLMGSVIMGVVVQLPPSKEREFRPAADALFSALEAQNISSSIELDPSLDKNKGDRIRIKVGKKP